MVNHEPLYERICRMMIEVIWCIQLGNPQIVEHHDTVRKGERLLLVMGDMPSAKST